MVENRSLGLMAVPLVLLLFTGCAKSGYNLAVGSAFYRNVDHFARTRNPGTIRVVFREDLRPPQARDHHIVGTQYVSDTAWSEPIPMSLMRVFVREVHESHLFSTALRPTGEHDFLLEVSLHHFRGTWSGGYLNYLVPWKKMHVSGRVHLVLSIWGRGGQDVYFYREYDRTTEQYGSNYSNGYRMAAQLIGKSLQWIVEHFLRDLEAEIQGFPHPLERYGEK